MVKTNEIKRYKALFSQKALQDLNEARTSYNLQQKGLSKRLIAEVKDVIASINQNPYIATVKFKNIPTAACKTFPYAIHYALPVG